MIRSLKIILLVFMMSAAAAVSGDELINITAAVDKQTAYIGDIIDYSITITYDSTIVLTPPATGANLGGFDVKDYEVGEETALDGGRRRQVLRFLMRTFTTGEYIIPPLPIEYTLPDSTKKYISADPIKINIKSVLAEGAAADTLQLRPLKSQASLIKARTVTWIIIAAAAAIIAAAAIYIWWRRRKKETEAAYVDPRPSWEIAYADLALLKDEDLPGKGEVKKFYFALSEIFRKYIGKKFEFDAIDLTTTEIDEVFERLTVDPAFRDETREFFDHADLVKFAKLSPEADRPDRDWNTAYELVSKSKDMIVTPPLPDVPEPVTIAAGPRDAEDYDEWRYAPPELRDRTSSADEEEAS